MGAKAPDRVEAIFLSPKTWDSVRVEIERMGQRQRSTASFGGIDIFCDPGPAARRRRDPIGPEPAAHLRRR